ncbi:MAG TPA: OmpH family outer membrane protein [Longimicrobiales bacterium]|nr:OmpH family outer membrane protein [Longimicrobiales bacterium]
MKQVIRSGMAVFALLVGAASLPAQAAPKLVFINSQRVMAEAPEIQQARSALQQEMQRLEQQIAPLQTSYQTMLEQYQQQQAMMTPENRRERQQALGAKQQEIQEKAAELEQLAQGKQQELLEPALARINTVIEQLRSERGYAFVFDVAGGGVIAADPALDITDEVLRRLRALASQGS